MKDAQDFDLDNEDTPSSLLSQDIARNELEIDGKLVKCYMYDLIKRDIFINWWSKTHWALTKIANKKPIYWNAEKKVAIWTYFRECAIIEDGTSRIICQRCKILIAHSSLSNDTHTAKQHLKRKDCARTTEDSELSQLMTVKSWRKIRNESFVVRLIQRLVELSSWFM